MRVCIKINGQIFSKICMDILTKIVMIAFALLAGQVFISNQWISKFMGFSLQTCENLQCKQIKNLFDK